MTRQEMENWKAMGMNPRGIRAINQLNKTRTVKVTTQAVNDLIAKTAAAIAAEKKQ